VVRTTSRDCPTSDINVKKDDTYPGGEVIMKITFKDRTLVQMVLRGIYKLLRII
jgi:hypothetical protein